MGKPLTIDDGGSSFVYGEGQVSSANASGTNFVLADALSSARLQTDGSGAVSGTASFDAFGAVRTSTGANTSFRFTGEYSDAETGWTFLRARYLDPLVGRFPSVDPVTPGGPGTGGWNAYAYVTSNPTRYIDPSGETGTETAAQNGESRKNAAPLAAVGRFLANVFHKLACALDIKPGGCRWWWSAIETAAGAGGGVAVGSGAGKPPWPVPPPPCVWNCGSSNPPVNPPGSSAGNPPAAGNPPNTGPGVNPGVNAGGAGAATCAGIQGRIGIASEALAQKIRRQHSEDTPRVLRSGDPPGRWRGMYLNTPTWKWRLFLDGYITLSRTNPIWTPYWNGTQVMCRTTVLSLFDVGWNAAGRLVNSYYVEAALLTGQVTTLYPK